MALCICPRCDRTFGGLLGFDLHQDVDYTRDPPIICRDPATILRPDGGVRFQLTARGVWVRTDAPAALAPQWNRADGD